MNENNNNNDNDNIGFKCPVDKALQLLNKKWSIQILRDLFFGKTRFNEFKEGKADLSNEVLASCLKNLEENGLVIKKILSSKPKVIEYSLTKRGESLNKVIYELAIFTLEKCDYKDYENEEVKNNIKETFKSKLNIIQ